MESLTAEITTMYRHEMITEQMMERFRVDLDSKVRQVLNSVERIESRMLLK